MKLIMIVSGGLDSAVSLYQLRQEHEVVEAVTFDYGQRHRREIKSAEKICAGLNLPHKIIDISKANEFFQGSSLTSSHIDTPHGEYTDENMKLTVVPNRNAIMINLAAAYAISKNIFALGLGVHAGDHYIYADCRPEFIRSQEQTLSLGNECDFHLLTPFLHDHKEAIVARGLALQVPFELTWTCYEGGETACRKCGACTEREGAFRKNGLKDPAYL